MAFSIDALLDPAAWLGATSGGGLLGFIAGQVKARNARIMRLEAEVAECRERDADVQILTAGVRMIVGKVQREQPESVELQMFNDLCNRRLGPAPETPDDFEALLRKIDEAERNTKK